MQGNGKFAYYHCHYDEGGKLINYNRLREQNLAVNNKSLAKKYGWQLDLNNIAIDAERTAKIAKYSESIIKNIDAQVEEATKLDKTDVALLLLATALPCIRQFLIGALTQRVDDKTAAQKTKGHDPLLGWIFGTINIATSTLTISEGLQK